MNQNARTQLIQSKLHKLQSMGVEITPSVMTTIASDVVKRSPVTWAMTYRALKGEPYRFFLPETQRSNTRLWVRHRPFLMKMMEDQAENKCYQKGRQAGGSENAITEAIWFCDTHPGTKIMYTFPSQPQVEDFSNTRIKPLLAETPYLQNLVGSLNNVTAKELGRSYLLLRSAQTPRLGEGVDTDCLYIDEKDRMPDKIEAAFEQSLSSSPWRLLREFSTPTLPGVGINKSFDRSCKYYWFVRCNSGHPQTLTFDDNIAQTRNVDPTSEYVIPGTYRFKCVKANCPSDINRWDGEWVAMDTEGDRAKTHAGYQISQLSCQWLSPDHIMAQKMKYQYLDLFYNYVLGIPYSSAEGLISPEQLNRQLDSTRRPPEFRRREYTSIVVGIDWGTSNVVTVLGRRFDGKVEVVSLRVFVDTPDVLAAPKEIAKFLAPFDPEVIVADAGYGVDRCNYLLSQFPERVYACYYSSGSATDKTYQPSWSEEPQFKVTVGRTMHLRNMLEFIKVRKLVFPGSRDYYETFFKHILNLALIHEEEENANIKGETVVVERIGKKGRDDWAHSLAYGLLALQKLTQGGSFAYQFF